MASKIKVSLGQGEKPRERSMDGEGFRGFRRFRRFIGFRRFRGFRGG